MVSLEVVNVLPENQRPQVFAKKLDNIQRIIETRSILRKPLDETLSHAISCHLELMLHGIAALLVLDSARCCCAGVYCRCAPTGAYPLGG